MYNKYKISLIALIVLVIGLVSYIGVLHYKSKQISSINNFLNDSVTSYKNKYGDLITQKSVLQGDINALNTLLSKHIDSTRMLSQLVEKYKDVHSAGQIITRTKIDSVFIPYEVQVDAQFSRPFSLSNKHFELSGQSNQDGIALHSLLIPNTLYFTLGKKKVGWFKTKQVIETQNSNPFVKTIGVDGYMYSERNKRFGVGPYIGYDVFVREFSAGVSIQYSLWRF